ncbi:uncharacterized protein DS421_15g509530 [Arachis hypogaea]|nr:uncharacterized protein DS421_15g509530 [Arachis hypogaea]
MKLHSLLIWPTARLVESFLTHSIGTKERSSSMMATTSCGMIYIFSKDAKIESLEDVSLMKKPKEYCGIIMVRNMKAILVEKGQPPKCFNVAYIGQLYSKKSGNLLHLVINAKELKIFQQGMKCHKTSFWKWNSLMC